ncbi:MAG: AAA family ATPase [Candidatus Sungbacteria bacterium]|nr:AAA family ATPase [Candidatus Sungbacteria bacterium]
MQKQPNIIAVVGLAASGKTEATVRFIERGFFRVGFNEPLYKEVARLGLERTQDNERLVRERLRKEYGMGVMADRSLPKVEAGLAEGKNVVAESLYSWAEYKIMKERFGDVFRALAIYTPPQIRYERLARRLTRPLMPDAARSRDYAEIEGTDKAGPIAIADWTISNLGSREEFLKNVDALIDEILKD